RLPGDTLAAKLSAPLPGAAVTAALAALAHLPSPPVAPKVRGAVAPPPFFRGVSLAMRNSVEDGYHAPGLGERLARLSRLGADAVSLMPFAFQPAADQPRLRYLNRGPASETDVGVVHAARAAHARGLRVLYKPHVWVGGGSWPGEIAMKNEADWALWWASYRRFVLHHAFVAAWAESDVFSLGCELSKTVGRLAEWRDLIAAVRLFFPDALTYSANWGEDLDRVRFWDRLDLVGVDAYYPLSASPAASPRDLDRGAAAVVKKLAAAARREGRPVLLTEVGFAARKAAWTAPSEEGGDYSEEDQEASYAALFHALGRPSWLAGTFVWKAFSGGEDRPDRHQRPGGRARQADFRFLGRRAESAIAAYYGGAAMPAARP
ncbi:MAG TPA: hypothetical protein VOA87_21380, partial [Thermoanaerobaculia bacterium]|nr:hypothetical protein [Thermoanaerobaculia bacterium]